MLHERVGNYNNKIRLQAKMKEAGSGRRNTLNPDSQNIASVLGLPPVMHCESSRGQLSCQYVKLRRQCAELVSYLARPHRLVEFFERPCVLLKQHGDEIARERRCITK